MKNLVAVLSFCMVGMPAYGVTVRCEAEYATITKNVSLAPVNDVFDAQSLILGGRFQFRAQYLQDRGKLKTWVYELRTDAAALIHASEHPLSSQICAQAPRDFGLNKVYSSDLQREMFFQCFAVCE